MLPVRFPIRRLVSFLPAAALALALCAGAATADDPAMKSAAAPQGDAAPQAATDAWLKYANPGKAHEALKPMVGTFKAVVKSWAGPGDPTVSEGIMENTLILGGRYLEGRYKGEFNGQPMEGVSLTGYDMKKGELISFWMDNMSTSWMTQTGALSEDGSTMTVKGSGDGPDGKPMELRSVTRIVDENQHVYTMSGVMNGQEVPMMEITYTRM